MNGHEDDARRPGAGDQPRDAEDGLAVLRDELESVDELQVGDRVAVFERVNEGIADELARLDEV